MAHPNHIDSDEDSLVRRISDMAADLQRRTEGLFQAPYRLEHRIIPPRAKNTYLTVAVLFVLSKNENDIDTGASYTIVVYSLEHGPLGKVLTATCTEVYSSIGRMVGSFLFLLQYRLAIELHTHLFLLDNMTDVPTRGANGVYSILIYQNDLDVDMKTMNKEGWNTVQNAYMTHRLPSESTSLEMLGIPYPSNEASRHKVALLWNAALTRIHDRVVNEDADTPWKTKATVTRIMNAFMLPSRMTLSRKRDEFSRFSIDMTRREQHITRSKKRNIRSMKRSKRASHSKRGGAQGAPLDQAFSGVVLPSEVYQPILKPMHGGDGVVYQAANLAAPAVYPPTKALRGRVKRSAKRKRKARAPGLPPGHALPPGFGQMVQSFRPL